MDAHFSVNNLDPTLLNGPSSKIGQYWVDIPVRPSFFHVHWHSAEILPGVVVHLVHIGDVILCDDTSLFFRSTKAAYRSSHGRVTGT